MRAIIIKLACRTPRLHWCLALSSTGMHYIRHIGGCAEKRTCSVFFMSVNFETVS